MELASSSHSAGRGLPARWWMIGSALIAVYLLQDVLLSRGGLIADEVYWGRDFINLWTGGSLVRSGRLDVLYDVTGYVEYQRQLFGHVGLHNYSYPPVSYPIAAAFSLLPYPLALAAWIAGTGVLFVFAARKWWPEATGPVWLAALTPAALVNIWTGQYGFLAGALFLFGWQRLDDKPRLAGLFFGLMLIKPHLALLVPLVLLIRREWTAIASAALTVAALVGLTTLWFGWQPWHDYLFRTSGVQAALIDAGDAFFGLMSCSSATAMLRLGTGWPVAIAVQVMVATAAVAAVVWAALRRAPTRDMAFLTATATFLILPYSFSYDLTVVAVGALVLLCRDDLSAVHRRFALYGFLAAQLGMVLAGLDLPGMPVLLGGLLLAQYRAICGNTRAAGTVCLPLFGERVAA